MLSAASPSGSTRARRAVARRAARRSAELILCAGLKSSGSTWLYNAVVQLCRDRDARRSTTFSPGVLPFYAETVEDFPSAAARAAVLVVKTHVPSPGLVRVANFVNGKIFITVREPRDAIASVMQRFDHRFDGCLKEIAASASRLVDIASSARATILKYEDGFCSNPETVNTVGRELAIRSSKATRAKIFQALTPSRIQRKIDTLMTRGLFGMSPGPDSFDPETQWHPGHVGDLRIGKYSELLSPKMQQLVLDSTAAYCKKFGYRVEISRPVVRRRVHSNHHRVASSPAME